MLTPSATLVPLPEPPSVGGLSPGGANGISAADVDEGATLIATVSVEVGAMMEEVSVLIDRVSVSVSGFDDVETAVGDCVATVMV